MKRGQVWVETVIYTLIALAMIGLVLAFVKPKIEEFQDRTIITQSIGILKEMDNKINDIKVGGAGNQRKIEIGIKKGSLKLDGENDELIFEMDSKSEYSEPGEEYHEGNVVVTTEKKGEVNLVKARIDYGNYNITYEKKDGIKTLTKASVPYNLLISNEGKSGSKIIINMELK